MMRRALPLACALALGAVGGVLLGGCGGGTKTVTAPGAPAASADAQAGAHTSPTASTASTPARTTPTTTTTTGTSSAAEQPASTTRTAPAPAFVHGGSAEHAASAETTAAGAVVAAHGYTARDLSDYHANQTLRVLIGTRTGAADPYDERAFFFLGNRYLGTDSTEPSASVNVAGQSDTEVTLTYALYRAHDSLCCPSGGYATVHFQLNNGQLVPLDPIPPANSSTGLARQ
jgi:hypothetical protein